MGVSAMTVPAQRTWITSVERMEILMRTMGGPHVPELKLPTLVSVMTVPAQRTLIMSVERMEILMRTSAGLHVRELRLPTLVLAKSSTDLILSRNEELCYYCYRIDK